MHGHLQPRILTLPPRTALLGFIRFNWVGPVRYFGHTALSTQLPRFYPFVWLPVMMSPIAFVVFLVVKGVNKLRREEAAPPPAPTGPTPSEALLTEIRDLLKTRA